MIAGTEASADEADEAQGDNRVTQRELERALGLSHTMFKNIVALNTYSEPFLAMKAAEQRDLIEQLLGITQLSEKAEILKEQLRGTKDKIKEEEFRVEAIKEANSRIEKNITGLIKKSDQWIIDQETLVTDAAEAIITLESINVEDEIEKHKELIIIKEDQAQFDKLDTERKQFVRKIASRTISRDKDDEKLATLEDQRCYTCDQELQGDTHKKLVDEAQASRTEFTKIIEETEKLLEEKGAELAKIVVEATPDTFYDDIEDVYNHRSSLESLQTTLETESARENHFVDQIESLQKTGLQTIDYTTMNDLVSLRDHQDFLVRLLTSKDSFIRKKIINQNLAYLNARLEYYLDRVGLPHKIKFMSDLTVEIREHGRDLDFDNLSRGERTRLILGLSWSFRDVYESLNTPISLLFIDELIDNGLDPAGVESALSVLKQMAREANRNVFLISHRDELVGRVGSVLKVIKESGFTSFESEVDLE